MIFLFLSLWGSFKWYPISENDINSNLYEVILNSGEGSSIIMQYGGEENLVKGFIHLYGDIFKGGGMVLLPKEFKITITPENLQLLKRAIPVKNYNRYSALYKAREFMREWKELERESEDNLGISSLENLSLKKLRELLPERVPPTKDEIEKVNIKELESDEIRISEKETERGIIYPRKYYFSFLLIEENWRKRLIPVILHLSPIDETIKKLKRVEE